MGQLLWYDNLNNEKGAMNMFDPWMLAAIDRAGYNGIRDEHIEAVAEELRSSGGCCVSRADFDTACRRCGIDPDSFTQSDLDELQDALNE